MARLTWDPSYSVGAEELDEQHQKLFAMINALGDAQDGVGSTPTVEIVASMADYASLHFKVEEEYMQRGNYPELTEHQEEHAQFVRKVLALCGESNWDSPTLAEEVLDFLQGWLIDHILISDSKFVPYIKDAA